MDLQVRQLILVQLVPPVVLVVPVPLHLREE
jgi:hypothetical protein